MDIKPIIDFVAYYTMESYGNLNEPIKHYVKIGIFNSESHAYKVINKWNRLPNAGRYKYTLDPSRISYLSMEVAKCYELLDHRKEKV